MALSTDQEQRQELAFCIFASVKVISTQTLGKPSLKSKLSRGENQALKTEHLIPLDVELRHPIIP